MTTVVVIGANGLVGKEICDFFDCCSCFSVIRVTRETISNFSNFKCDVLINANGSSKKGWCNENQINSFDINCNSIYTTIQNFLPKRYILISSVDVYPFTNDPSLTKEDQQIKSNLLTPYGFHKYIAELIVMHNYSNFLILRLSNVVSKDIKKNVLFDLTRKRKIFISPLSLVNFIDTETTSQIIYQNLLRSDYKIINVAANNSIRVSEIIEKLNLKEYYKKLDISQLPKLEYKISTKRLNRIFELGSSSDYVDKYLKAFK